MSKETPSRDLAFEKIWKEMDEIEPLTPIVEDSMKAYKEAALSDSYMFGEYDGYQAYKRDE
jgi:hypothetical protein